VPPVEAGGILGPDAFGEAAEVEPGRLPIGRARERQRPHEGDGGQGRQSDPGAQRDALEPEKADRERGEHHAEEDGAAAAERDQRRRREHEQGGKREERVAAAGRTRPEGQQSGRHAEQGAEQLEGQGGPRVHAGVRQADRDERSGGVREPARQLAPACGAQQPDVEAGGRDGSEQGGDRHEDPGGPPAAVRQRRDGPDRGPGAGREDHPEQRARHPQTLDEPAPLEGGEHREGKKAAQPGSGDSVRHAAQVPDASASRRRSSIRRILPVSVLGSSVTNSTLRG
jgi:hypothetical protein